MKKNLFKEVNKELDFFIKELKSGYFTEIKKDHPIYQVEHNQNLKDFDKGFLSYRDIVFPSLENNFSNHISEFESEYSLFSLGSFLPLDLAAKLLSDKTFFKYEILTDIDILLFFLKITKPNIDNGNFKVCFDRYINNFQNLINKNNKNYLFINLNTIDLSKVISSLEYKDLFDEIYLFEHDLINHNNNSLNSETKSLQSPGIKVPFYKQSEFLKPVLDCFELNIKLVSNEKNYSFYKISRN